MSDVDVTISGQSNPSVTISGQTNPSVVINTLESPVLSNQITSNDAELSSLNAATGVLDTSVSSLQTATGLLSTATGALETTLSALDASLGSAATTNSSAYATAAQGAKADSAEAATSNISPFGLTLLDDADAAAAQTTLGLGSVEDKSSADIRSEIVDSDIPSTVARLADPVFTTDIKSTSYEAADFPDTTSVRTTAAFKEDGTMVQDSKVIVKKVTGAEAKAMSFGTPSSWIEMIPAPGANKVIVVRDVEIFIDRGTWTPMNGGQVRGWGGDLQLVIETPALTNGGIGSDSFDYNTYAVLQKKFLNHTINSVYVAASAVDTIIVRDTPVTQTRAYANVPLLLRPKSAITTSQLTTYSHTPDDDYYFRITYKIIDMSSDFSVTTT